MSPKLTALVQRVKNASEPPGKKTALARFLNVPIQQVSGWLSGFRKPSGETTLQLLEWVAAEEAQQNKMPAQVLRTPTRAATRQRRPREKKPTSGRGKK